MSCAIGTGVLVLTLPDIAAACSRASEESVSGTEAVLPRSGSTAPLDTRVWIIDSKPYASAADAASTERSLGENAGSFCDAPSVTVNGKAWTYSMTEMSIPGEETARLRMLSFSDPFADGAEVVVSCGTTTLTGFHVSSAASDAAPAVPRIGAVSTNASYFGACTCGEPSRARFSVEGNAPLTLFLVQGKTPTLTASEEYVGLSTGTSAKVVNQPAGSYQLSAYGVSLSGEVGPAASVGRYEIDDGSSGCGVARSLDSGGLWGVGTALAMGLVGKRRRRDQDLAARPVRPRSSISIRRSPT